MSVKPPEPDAAFEVSLRPPMFSEFTGQVKVCERLELLVEAAKKRGDVLEHILLSGPPGLGKTTLAHIIANAMGVNIKNTSGPVIEKAGELAGLLTSLEKGDVLFIDEIHRLQPTIEEYLYPAMEDYRLDIIIDQGPQARSLRLQLPKFTLIGATTRAGMVSAPFRSRFGMTARLDYYNAEEMQKIIVRSAGLLGVEIDAAGADRNRRPHARHTAHGEQSTSLGARLRSGESGWENYRGAGRSRADHARDRSRWFRSMGQAHHRSIDSQIRWRPGRLELARGRDR